MADWEPCGGGSCPNEGVEVIMVQGGGYLGRLCPDCAEGLEQDLGRRMVANQERHDRREARLAE